MNGALLNSQPTSQPPVVSPPAAAVAHHRGGVLFCRLVSTSVRCGVIRTMRCSGFCCSLFGLSARAKLKRTTVEVSATSQTPPVTSNTIVFPSARFRPLSIAPSTPHQSSSHQQHHHASTALPGARGRRRARRRDDHGAARRHAACFTSRSNPSSSAHLTITDTWPTLLATRSPRFSSS